MGLCTNFYRQFFLQIIAIPAVIAFTGHALIAQQDWHLKKDENGIKVFTKNTDNSDFKSIRVECNINARISQLVAFLLDIEKQKEWVYNYKNSELIKIIAANEVVFYAEVCLPWPCSNRDYISHITINQPSAQLVVIDSHTEPDLVPIKSGRVRIRTSSAHWEVTALSNNLQRIVYTVQFDPGGSVPSWLVNMFVTKGPYHTFQKIREGVVRPEYQNAHLDFIKE